MTRLVRTGFWVLAQALLLFAFAVTANAQTKVPVVGFLGTSTIARDAQRIAAFQQGLRELGWIDGKNIRIEFRYADGALNRLPGLAAALVKEKVDVIVARGSQAIQAAREITNSVPIVMLAAADPVRTGFVSSLARPGGNITGMSTILPELSGKRLQLLKEVLPKLTRVGFLSIRGVGSSTPLFIQEAVDAGRSFDVQVHPLFVKDKANFEEAFTAIKDRQMKALIVQPFFVGGLGLGTQIANLAKKSRVATVSDFTRFVDEGGLLAYGPDVLDVTRRGAHHVDKILKGAKPSELPVEQPTKFSLGVNLKTATEIGATIPPTVLARADKVIR